jgi:lipid-A-disaccharide synthase
MVIVYKLSPITFFVGKLIVKVRYIGLVNLLLEKSVQDDTGIRIKELLQDNASATNIFYELCNIIDSQIYRTGMLSQLSKIEGLYKGKRASARVAEMVLELCNA